jgi:glycosyltransferase involved in cell wall biosynthesis
MVVASKELSPEPGEIPAPRTPEDVPCPVRSVCLVCMELFGLGSLGGFGRATRMIGRELVKRGIRVTAVSRQSPWSQERRQDFLLDGIRVRLYCPRRPLSSIALYRDCGADLYHSQDASLGTFLAMLAMPRAKHVITFRAPLDGRDIAIDRQFGESGLRGQLMHYLQIDNPLVRAAVRRTPWRYAAAHCVVDKAVRRYSLRTPPEFLPTPVVVPAHIEKAQHPTVCFVGRWHRIKQPEHFLELARQFPTVNFIAVGGASEQARDAELRQRYGGTPNLEMTGPIDQFTSNRLGRILSKSWILVNSSLRESLPTTFIEAAAHRCAILSYLDPEGFASRFGQVAKPGKLGEGLRKLLQDDAWRELGQAGYNHVRDIYSVGVTIDRHVEIYRQALQIDRSRYSLSTPA